MEPGDFLTLSQEGRTVRIQLIGFEGKLDDKDKYVCFIFGGLKTPYRWIDREIDHIYVRPGTSGIELYYRNPDISGIEFWYIGIVHFEHSSWKPLIGEPTGIIWGRRGGEVYYFSVSPVGGSLIAWCDRGKFNLFKSELSGYSIRFLTICKKSALTRKTISLTFPSRSFSQRMKILR